jgi:hypothetical protein
MQALCKANGSLVSRFFGRIEMALNLNINVPFSKNSKQFFYVPSGLFRSSLRERRCQNSFLAAAEADQPLGVFRDFFQRRGPCPFYLFPQFVAGHQTTDVLVSGAVLGEQSQPDRSRRNPVWHPGGHACLSAEPFHGDFRAHMGADSCFLGRHVEARGTVDSIAVQQGNGWQLKSRRFADQVLGQGSALQETERGARMKFHIHQS